ncbi:tetratricopeptide repeat protein [Psychromonas algicola]|uniref:tetratricopeptide repeat protein n=1 Tax=Psychromonas algicola TaxID=2555642 RepID=UPI001067743B|nr:tetratricopeptide repeat protein [Psychromonas sp. RZ5]TEW51469.1 tetratricopeptide repeat protein [Psychromonas sp. RZ5]
MNITEQIENYVENEDISGLDSIYDELLATDNVKAKTCLADGYLSYIGQCHYDFMCGKFNNFEDLKSLLELIDRVMLLNPNEESEHFYRGTLFEALSTCCEEMEQQLFYQALCLEHLTKHNEKDGDDLINFAQNIFRYCELKKNFDSNSTNQMKSLLKEAVLLERKQETNSPFFDTAISSFFSLTYDFISAPNNEEALFTEFMSEFKDTIEKYKSDPMVYFHWAKAQLHFIDQIKHYESVESSGTIDQLKKNEAVLLWDELKSIVAHIVDWQSDQEHFLISLGRIFERIADKEFSLKYYQEAYSYYLKAYQVNKATWSTPQYATTILKKMALVLLSQGKKEEAHNTFMEGFPLLEAAQKEIDDFQLSLRHADYFYDYAVYFENQENPNTLKKALAEYEKSRILAKDFYSSPFYGLAKMHLLLGDKDACLKVLEECGTVHSNEYHAHDFEDIFEDETFTPIHEELKVIFAKLSESIIKE